jgi:peptidoglycan hydrolase-like protein with peptidoglycan-binding domain
MYRIDSIALSAEEERTMRTRTSLGLAACATFVAAGLAFANEPANPTSPASRSAIAAAEGSGSMTHAPAQPAHFDPSKEEIIALQKALKQAGLYKGKVDGRMGKQTDSALRSYQKEHGLQVTGLPDTETMAKLGIASASNATPAATGGGSLTVKK